MARSKYALYCPELTEYRNQAIKRRAEAFCDVPEYVLGTEVKPLTPATFSMLIAKGSAFVTGGPIREGDIIDYLWFHSPLHSHTGVRGWKKRKRRALRRFMFEVCQPWRKWIGLGASANRARAALALAATDIREILQAAFADAPAKSAKAGKPLATLEAFFIHEFASAYQWSPEKTRATPLKQLMQLHRCIRASRGDPVSDEKEDRILAAHHEKMQAQYDAKKEGVNHG